MTGMSRVTRHSSCFFLAAAILPFMWPGWAMGGGVIMQSLVGGSATTYAVASLILVGAVLTMGPVLYNTVERVQWVLMAVAVPGVVVLVISLAGPEDWWALAKGVVGIGTDLHGRSFWGLPEGFGEFVTLLGALAYAGCGGALNLAQSLWVRDKGYAMGAHIGRITSPVTGDTEAIPSTGFAFALTEEGIARWKGWWRAANREHAITFWIVGLSTLLLLAMLAHATLLHPGQHLAETRDALLSGELVGNIGFLTTEASMLSLRLASGVGLFFLVLAIFILLSTELGVIDGVSRIVTDILSVNVIPGTPVGRIYFTVLWVFIGLGVAIITIGSQLDPSLSQPLVLLIIGAALNACVMFLYSGLLLYMNWKRLPSPLQPSLGRKIALAWSSLFFGAFTIITVWNYL
jgi:hypothetical protein